MKRMLVKVDTKATKAGDEDLKMLITCPHAFLRKNKGSFIRQTFLFLSESILLFFSFLTNKGQKHSF